MNFLKKPRREPMSLQLTAMIDIFSMIVIFLVLGSVLNNSEAELPADFMVPKSLSKESADSAARVVINSNQVEFAALKITVPLATFTESANAKALNGIKEQLKSFIDRSPSSVEKKSARVLNVVADERVGYDKLYDVLSAFKEAGFETLLFVTTSKGSGL